MIKTGLILANGEPPSKTMLVRLRKSAYYFVCADGGANAAAKLGVKPDLIIGDLDSIAPETQRKFGFVTTRRIADQNSTDLEKALSWMVKQRFKRITVLGATGGRLDHFIGNLSALAKFSRKASIVFVDKRGEWMYVGRSFKLDAAVGLTVSLVPLSRCEGIATHGLKWELRNETLELGLRESTSNVVKSTPLSIRVRSGSLLLYAFHSKPEPRNPKLA